MVAEVAGPRERYRAQMQAEIKQRAWEQIASTGVAALSLKAIAKQMGMSGPALYRYFPSRDELITALISDATAAWPTWSARSPPERSPTWPGPSASGRSAIRTATF